MIADHEIIYQSGIDLADKIRNGEITSEDATKAHLKQIDKHNNSLNAVVIHTEDKALKTANACDREAKEDNFRGPLHGVPMTIKEQYWLEGEPATINSSMYEGWIAPEDAVVVDRLKKAGAVILGKTNVPQNLLDYQVWGDIYPDGKNPYDTAYSPGGSSGGAAAALASGMVPLELGGDMGGSTRIPSYFCGLYGIKPTEYTVPIHGLVPKLENEKGHIFEMVVPSPMARTIEDMELLWKIIRGPHHGDRRTPRIDWKDPSDKQLSDFNIAWVDRWPGYEPSDEIQQVIHNLVDTIHEEGSKTENNTPGNDLHERSLSVWMRLAWIVLAQDVSWYFKPFMKMDVKRKLLKGMEKFKKEFKQGFKSSFLNYSETMGHRAEMVSEWEQYFEDNDFDLLICPMSFGPTYKRRKVGSEITYEGKTMKYLDYSWPYVACFNASGHPAMNLPLGLNDDGLPVGVQVVGPYWSEPEMIHFAKLISEKIEGFVRPEEY